MNAGALRRRVATARTVEDRLAAIETVVRTGGVYARRLVICDEAGRERIVAGLSFGVAEVRVTLDAGGA